MGVKSQFQKGVASIMKQAGDVPFDITYKVHTVGASDGMGGTVTPSFVSKTVQAFVYDYTQKEIATSGLIISPGDRKVIIEVAKLTALGVTSINIKDEMTIKSKDYKIVEPFKKDPADAAYFFQVRQK
jgi:hypothetical protein